MKKKIFLLPIVIVTVAIVIFFGINAKARRILFLTARQDLLGIKPSKSRMIKLAMEKAAKQGNVKAEMDLSKIYGQQEDYKKSAQWLKKAAGQGDITAMRELSDDYFSGQGVRKNNVKGQYWFMKSVMQKGVKSKTDKMLIYR